MNTAESITLAPITKGAKKIHVRLFNAEKDKVFTKVKKYKEDLERAIDNLKTSDSQVSLLKRKLQTNLDKQKALSKIKKISEHLHIKSTMNFDTTQSEYKWYGKAS